MLEDAGHFVHIEQPARSSPTSSSTSCVVTVDPLAPQHGSSWRCTSCAAATGRPLLLLHGLGERSPADGAGRGSTAGPAPVCGARLHRPRRVDGARRRRLHRRGADGRRRRRARPPRPGRRSSAAASAPTSPCSSPAPAPTLVRGRDPRRRPRPGRRGSVAQRRRRSPTRGERRAPGRHARTRGRCSSSTRDVRPPDYAADLRPPGRPRSSGLDAADRRRRRGRPPWLEAVAAEPGVIECTLAEALAAASRRRLT